MQGIRHCLFCDNPSYPNDEDHVTDRVVGRRKRCKGVLRLDKLTKHIKDKHPECIPPEGRSIPQMGFTMTGADASPHSPKLVPADDGNIGPEM